MGHQIIPQPDGLYAVFSSFSDTWILWDATPEELLRYYAKQAAEESRERVARIISDVDEDPRKAYYQFAMTFAEANEASVEHGGEDLSGKLAPDAADG
jgi:hypothetical protein